MNSTRDRRAPHSVVEQGSDPRERARALAVLWACVGVFVVVVLVLLRGNMVIYEATNTEDVGPLDGLVDALAVVGGVLFGALPLGFAVVASLPRVRFRRPARVALAISLYTAVCGVVTAAYWIYGAEQTAAERRVLPGALRQGELLMGSPALIGLLPLAVLVVLRGGGRSGVER